MKNFPFISAATAFFQLRKLLFIACFVWLFQIECFSQARIGSTEMQIQQEFKSAVKIFEDEEDKVYEINKDTCKIRHYLVNNVVVQSFIIPLNMIVFHNFAEKFSAENKVISPTEWLRKSESGDVRIVMNKEGRLYYYLFKREGE